MSAPSRCAFSVLSGGTGGCRGQRGCQRPDVLDFGKGGSTLQGGRIIRLGAEVRFCAISSPVSIGMLRGRRTSLVCLPPRQVLRQAASDQVRNAVALARVRIDGNSARKAAHQVSSFLWRDAGAPTGSSPVLAGPAARGPAGREVLIGPAVGFFRYSDARPYDASCLHLIHNFVFNAHRDVGARGHELLRRGATASGP